jgi:hypothetical protein
VDTVWNNGDQGSRSFESLSDFAIASGFQSELNELSFKVTNGGGPTALLVAGLAGSAEVIPEPSTALLLATGLAGLAAAGRRRRRAGNRAREGGTMLRIFVFIFVLMLSSGASASPISVGGFSFLAGEQAFADDASLVSGVITGANEETIRTVLVGSNIADSFNTGDSGGGIVEVRFTDNLVRNGSGTDLVIFELSGDKPAGTPDPREIFAVSVFDGSTFSSFVTVTPIATGFPNPADPTLDVFAVEIDIGSFGVPMGGTTDRVRLHIFNANLGSKSADLTALGALNSAPIPEPSTALLLAAGLAGLALRRRLMA